MHGPTDPVDRALESLKRRDWPGGHHNFELESRLMRSFDKDASPSFVVRHRVLLPVLALLLVAGVCFAAGGGIELIQSWFATTTVDGKVIDQREIVPGDGGSASYTVPLPPADGSQRTVCTTVERRGEGSDEGKTVTVTVDGDTDQAEVTITPSADDDD